MTPDFKALTLSIQRCDAVYLPDANKAIETFQSLGSTNIVRFCTDDNQAIFHIDADGVPTLTDAGTRFTDGTLMEKICDVYQDIDCVPYDIGGDRHVAKRPFMDAYELYNWTKEQAQGRAFKIEGQSLGGWKPSYAGSYLPLEQIISLNVWDSPLQGDAAWWQYMKDCGLLDKMQQMYNGRDPWALWPWNSDVLTKGPGQILWTHDGIWEYVTADKLPKADVWDMYDLPHYKDHDPSNIVTVYQALLQTA